MRIDKTEELLKRFDYKYQRKNNEITIKLDFSQRIIMDFSDSEKVIIKDKLVSWNFLTGLIEMSIKNATLYNFIGATITTFLFLYMDLEFGEPNLIFFYLLFVIWVLLWTIFYLVKAENIKRILISWNQH
jgi:hypothetical protein